jgi:phosphoserine aminotransferase
MLPESVLQQAKEELLDWQGSGQSVMEMSHRGKEFMAIAEQLKNDLIEVMAIPSNYKVLFLQGGATGQFAFIPQNILKGKTRACYVNTGAWSEKALKEAKKYCEVVVSASSEDTQYTTIPAYDSWQVDPEAAYLHYTDNETIHGVEFQNVPDFGDLPLVSDMSSNILSRSLDVSKFGLIYAGSQKNMGPAGLTVVIVREDLVGHADKHISSVFDYAQQDKNDSMLNTPATYIWYLTGLVLQWIKANGGVSGMEQLNKKKADLLYQTIDSSSLYSNPVEKSVRSRMNVPFVLADANLDKEFLQLAEANGLSTLKGHRSVGGMRASIYNAMPEAGVKALVEFMAEFERTHG